MNENRDKLDLVWGLEAISKIIGRTVRQTHYMLSTGKIPAKQIGNRWVVERGTLLRFFMESAA